MTAMATLEQPLHDPLTSAYPFLDAARLSDLVDAEVCAGGLRHKPFRSTSASLVDRRTGRPSGWAQVLLGHQPQKVANARRRATDRRLALQVRALPDLGGVLLHGPVDTDPRLHRGLATIAPVVPDVAAAIGAGTVEVLRYNALRRLVLRGGGPGAPGVAAQGGGVGAVPATEVVRVSAQRRGPGLRAAAALAKRGIPVGAAVIDPVTPTSRHVTVWPWVDGVDLSHSPDPAAAGEAALALGEIHTVADSVGGQRIMGMLQPGEQPRVRTARIVADILAIAPDLTGRLIPLVDRLPEPAWDAAHIVHGDFSADQVILCSPRDRSDRGDEADQAHRFDEAPHSAIRIIDLDRVRLGDPHEDLGCFAAAELRRTGHWGLLPELVDAYPRPVRRGSLHAWTLHALVMRLLEPFRSASPTWRSELAGRLDEIERVQAEGVLT